uniref:Uncharacterized protein n=1 Tax=Megaselia scalaris TaxID=36166 RepID=T1GSJ9_MEGSC
MYAISISSWKSVQLSDMINENKSRQILGYAEDINVIGRTILDIECIFLEIEKVASKWRKYQKHDLKQKREKSQPTRPEGQHGKVQHRGCEQFRLPGFRSPLQRWALHDQNTKSHVL